MIGMSETAAPVDEAAVSPRPSHGFHRHRHNRGRSRWRTLVLASVGDGSRRRRASDAVRVGLAIVVVGLSIVYIASGPSIDLNLAADLTSVPLGLHWLTSTLWYLGSAGVIIALALIALASRRLSLARDTAVTGFGIWLLALGLSAWLGDTAGRPTPSPSTSTSIEFPVIQLAAAVGVAVVLMPYLSRPARRLFGTLVVLAAVAAVLRGSGLPLVVLASMVMGWGFAAAVHLVFGSPTGLPAPAEVERAVDDLGYELRDVAAVDPQVWGVARFTGQIDGDRVDVSVYGRDAADAQFLSKAWRFLWYRDSGPTLLWSRLQQVEHEAFLAMSAAQAGVVAAEVIGAGMDTDGDAAALITRPPPGRRLADLHAVEVTPAVLDAIFTMLAQLRSAGIAHGALSADTIVVADDGTIGFRDFRSASVSADGDRLDRDLAGVMVSAALVAGALATVDAVGRVLGAEALTGALAHLQPAALDRANRARLHDQKKLLGQLRDTGAEEIGGEVPKLVDIRRMSWGSFGMGVGAALGVYLIVQEFSGVENLGATLKSADWAWVVLAFVLAQLTNVAQAFSVMGSVSSDLPFGPTLALELANAFTGLVAGTLGSTATIIRYFQRRGLAVSVAVSSGVLVSIATMITQAMLFATAFLLSRGDFTWSDSSSSSGSGSSAEHGSFLLLLLALGIAAVGAVTLVPRFRRQAMHKLRPQVEAARTNLKELASQPGKLVRLFGGAIVSQLLFAMVLGASLHAYGASLSLAELLVINTLASLLGGIAPVPGGMGVIEAGLIAGMTAAGIPSTIAVAATLTSRLCTAYLPPIWGYPSLVWMRRNDYL